MNIKYNSYMNRVNSRWNPDKPVAFAEYPNATFVLENPFGRHLDTVHLNTADSPTNSC